MHYYQHHIGDFIRDTANLSDSQCMTYLRLIWAYYDTEEPIEDAPKKLAFKLGSDVDTVELLLESFFQKGEKGWHHKRIDAEISAYHSKAEKARKSASARWSNSERNSNAMRTHSDSTPSAIRTDGSSSKVDANQEPITNISTTNVVESERPPPQRSEKNSSPTGTRLPNDWVLPREWGLWAVGEGLTETQVRTTADTFRDHWISKAGKEAKKADWLATWRNWVRRDLSKIGGSYGNAGHEKRQSADNSAPARVTRAIARRDAQLGKGVPSDDFIELGSSDYQTVPY